MPFPNLKKALETRGGKKSSDGNSVSFYKNDDKLTFSGTNEKIPGLDGSKHERVEIMRNGDDLNLNRWLYQETPILMTGNQVVKNIRGNPKNCINICDNILKDLGFQKEGLRKKINTVNDNKVNEDINNEDRLLIKEEREMNDNFYYDFFEKRGFYFSKEILSRYFLSLRTKPFVILTGISGTGKTKIAQLFADYILQDKDPNQKEKQFAFIPVRPDWMDNKGLLGFYNILDQKYSSTKFLQIIIDASNNPDEPYFVILDEMNLSKVEMYFSDLLSIMETRTRTKNNEKGEAIDLHSSGKEEEVPQKIHIPRNVFIAGTVNVDETTYMFSPKVLDRANVIEFNEVDLEGYAGLSPKKEDRFCLSNQDLRNELINPQEQPFCSRDDYLKVREILGNTNDPMDELLKILKKHTVHFGYRVVNEMSRFIWLSREYLGEQFDFNEAFDIQILQKILPKFHGTQAKLEQPLKGVLAFCYGNEPIEFDNKFIEEASVSADGARYVRTAQKLAGMILNLQTQGYTSFIE